MQPIQQTVIQLSKFPPNKANQSANQATQQPSNQAAMQPSNQSNQSTNQPINQATNQPCKQPTKPNRAQASNKPTKQATNQPPQLNPTQPNLAQPNSSEVTWMDTNNAYRVGARSTVTKRGLSKKKKLRNCRLRRLKDNTRSDTAHAQSMTTRKRH